MDAGGITEAFLQQAPACSWVLDARYRFVRVFGPVAPLFGSRANLIEDRTLDEVCAPHGARAWKNRVDRCLEGERLALRERQSTAGYTATYYVSLFPLMWEEERAAAGLALEVTPWSTAEQALRHTVLGSLRAREFERNTMAKFLHDRVGQNLSATGLHLDLLRMDLETVSPESGARIGEIQQLLESMMEEVREFSYELNPAMVERAGLRTALDRLIGKVRGRYTGAVRLIFDPSIKIAPQYASAMYQIAQEAVSNALQHSGCSLIEIAVKSSRTGPSLEVRDNGCGFDPADVLGGRRGLGLLTMEHFAAQAGLDIVVESHRDQGTVVRVSASEGERS